MALGFRIALNGEELATVSTADLRMLDVRVHGDRLGPHIASLDVSGMQQGTNDEPDIHLTWVNLQNLVSGDRLNVAILPDAQTSRPGATFDELFPDYEPPHGPVESREEALARVASEPKVHETVRFKLSLPDGSVVADETSPTEHAFAFSVSWVWMHPERVRAFLHCYDLDYLAQRKDARDLVNLKLFAGAALSLQVE